MAQYFLMSKSKANKKISQEKILFAVGAVLLIIILSIVVYSLKFLSNKVFPALSSDVGSGDQNIRFNVEGFEELGL